uniref:Tubulin polyglutamylase ttll-4 n=1 Tax=Syphacia muris TaxID=451379 RepID=A0A0N5A8K9_9BILA
KDEAPVCSLTCLVTNLCPRSSSSTVADVAQRPFLRPSLFANVPPTIRFYVKDGILVSKPSKSICSKLTWCHNSLLPLVVRRSLSASHFKIVNENSKWIGYWGRHLKSSQYKTVEPYQKINHFPGAFHIGRKDRLWQHIQEMMQLWGEEEYCIMPKTYILPFEIKKLKEYLCSSKWRNVIIKPPASARGTGITIASRARQIPVNTSLVAQHYLERPLIINGAKFDLRLYVHIPCLDPLRIYFYKEGLVRFASVPSTPSSYSNKFIHLTNYSINKFAESAGERTSPVPKWSLSELWCYMANDYDVPLLKRKIVDVIIKAVLACENSIRSHQKKYSKFTFTSHELYGMDILIDQDLKPWLLEVNISPSLHSGTPLDARIKAPLAKDVLNLCGVQIPPQQSMHSDLSIDYAVKPFYGFKTKADLKKEAFYVDCYEKYQVLFKVIDPSIIDVLTSSDIRTLVDFEDEFNRAGDFELIFPTVEHEKYWKYFNEILYSNMLLMQWQKAYSNDRTKGRNRLNLLCKEHKHQADVCTIGFGM